MSRHHLWAPLRVRSQLRICAGSSSRGGGTTFHLELLLFSVPGPSQTPCTRVSAWTCRAVNTRAVRERSWETTFLPLILQVGNLVGLHEVPEKLIHSKKKKKVKMGLPIDSFSVSLTLLAGPHWGPSPK